MTVTAGETRVTRVVTNWKFRHLASLLFAAALVGVFGWLRPEWSPMHRWNRAFGDASLVLVALSMAIGPLSRLWRRAVRWLPWRREFGIWGFMAGLVHADFLAVTPWVWLTQFPRYFACLRHCVQRMTSGGLKTEQELAEQVRPWQERLEKRTRSSHRSPMLDHYRWMLEEYRVRLLAPRLGTAIDVSEQKLDDYWQAIP